MQECINNEAKRQAERQWRSLTPLYQEVGKPVIQQTGAHRPHRMATGARAGASQRLSCASASASVPCPAMRCDDGIHAVQNYLGVLTY